MSDDTSKGLPVQAYLEYAATKTDHPAFGPHFVLGVLEGAGVLTREVSDKLSAAFRAAEKRDQWCPHCCRRGEATQEEAE